jgi:hypothetical protein
MYAKQCDTSAAGEQLPGGGSQFVTGVDEKTITGNIL